MKMKIKMIDDACMQVINNPVTTNNTTSIPILPED